MPKPKPAGSPSRRGTGDALPKRQPGAIARISAPAQSGSSRPGSHVSWSGTPLALRVATKTMTDPPKAPLVAPAPKPPGERDEGIALILAVRLLQVLIIFVLWLVMR